MGITINGAIEYLTDFSIYSPYKEAIDKVSAYIEQMQADYENRLKADLKAILVELQLEIEEQCKIPNNNASAYDWNNGVYACYKAVQQKIDKLKGE